MLKKKAIAAIIIAVSVLSLSLAGYVQGYFEKPENLVYDMKARLFRSGKIPPKQIKTILVDDASIKALEPVAGRWPWPRAVWADLLDFLSLGGARMVLFDILFTERSDASNDGALVETTTASGNVIHSMILQTQRPDDERRYNTGLDVPLPKEFIDLFAVQKVKGSLPPGPRGRNNDFALPMTELWRVSQGVAVVEFAPDSDNVLRRTQPLREYQGRMFPVLGLAPFIQPGSEAVISADAIALNDRSLPIDERGNYLINMYDISMLEPYSMGGILASLQMIRSGDVESLLVKPDEFRDAIVFIGASAVGAQDLKATPMASSAPGVLMHVSLAGNYLENDFLSPPKPWLTILSIVLGALATTAIIFLSGNVAIRAVFPPLLLLLYVAAAFLAFRFNLLVDAVPFSVTTASSIFLSFGYIAFTEGAEKRRVSQLFTQYVSKDVLDEVLHNYEKYLKTASGQRVEITVLFSDIRGFTTMSETTPPEKIVEMLNVHFSHMADIILKHDGTLDKYIGDAIMAFWGAPVPTQDHAEKAVRAALEMADALALVNRELKERGFEHEVRIGIGINTGVATIGNIGSEKKLNYTVVGDTVNLASRLESLTKEHNSTIVISEYTRHKIKDLIDCEILGNVKVKGREQPVTIYMPVNDMRTAGVAERTP